MSITEIIISDQLKKPLTHLMNQVRLLWHTKTFCGGYNYLKDNAGPFISWNKALSGIKVYWQRRSASCLWQKEYKTTSGPSSNAVHPTFWLAMSYYSAYEQNPSVCTSIWKATHIRTSPRFVSCHTPRNHLSFADDLIFSPRPHDTISEPWGLETAATRRSPSPPPSRACSEQEQHLLM